MNLQVRPKGFFAAQLFAALPLVVQCQRESQLPTSVSGLYQGFTTLGFWVEGSGF